MTAGRVEVSDAWVPLPQQYVVPVDVMPHERSPPALNVTNRSEPTAIGTPTGTLTPVMLPHRATQTAAVMHAMDLAKRVTC